MERLQVPPIRTPLEEGNGQPAAPGAARTAKEWYLYWRQAGERVNAHADSIGELEGAVDDLIDDVTKLEKAVEATIRAGTHAERLVTKPDPLGALWMETDRQNIVYQARVLTGPPVWVYVTGAMYGTIIAVDQRPAGLGVNDTGLVFLSKDSTSVRWNGATWDALDRVLDLGPAPTVSQLVAKANGTGALSLLAYAQDNQNVCFDVEYSGGWVARAPTCAWIVKTAGLLKLARSAGNTVGGTPPMTDAVSLDLATGFFGIGTMNPAYLLSLGASVSSKKLAVFDNSAGTFYGFGIRTGYLEHRAPAGAGHSFIASETGEVMQLNADASIKMFLSGAMRSLSVDGSGFVKAT